MEFLLPGLTVGAFGNKFRKAREKRNFSLDDVANVTKIGSRMLQAIEEEHFDLLPGGVFNRGFIRAYAKHLGLNDEEAVSEYLECLREAQINAQTGAATNAPTPQADRAKSPTERKPEGKKPYAEPKAQTISIPHGEKITPEDELPELQLPKAEHVRPKRNLLADSPSIPWKLPAVAIVLIALAVFFWSRHSRNAGTGAAQSAAAPTGAMMTAEAKTMPSAAATIPSAAPSTPAPTQAKPQTTPPSANLATPNQAATRQTDTSDVTVKKIKQPTSDAVAVQPTFSLTVRAAENSWISISADGQTVTQETLIAPAHTSVRAHNEIVVKAGNAAGITFVFNGKEIPTQGAEGEVRIFTFDSTGLKPSTN